MPRHPVNIPTLMGSRFQLFAKTEKGRDAVNQHSRNSQNPNPCAKKQPDLQEIDRSLRVAGRKRSVQSITDAGNRQADLRLRLISDIFRDVFHSSLCGSIFFQDTQKRNIRGKGYGTEKPEQHHGPESIGKNPGGFPKAQPDNQHSQNNHTSRKAHI